MFLPFGLHRGTMQASTAKDEILDNALAISPAQFEQLCRILIKRSEKTRELELTPTSGDEGIDVHAVVDRELFQARLGVQAKRLAEGNSIGSDKMRLFKGSLDEGNYHVGTYITTASFSNPAIESANLRYIRTIDGATLSDIMLRSEIGVIGEADDYSIDWEFWEIFEMEGEGDLIRSDAVPQADTVEVMNLVLRAIEAGHDVKPTITKFMEAETGQSWDPRQADYYCHAAWPLGFVHKDTKIKYGGYERRQWTLSRIGQEYVEYLKSGSTSNANNLLYKQIREMEIAKRVLSELEEEGTLSHPELQEIVHQNTLPEEHEHGLSKSTAYRRGNTIGKWIEKLPEVTRHGPDNNLKKCHYEYLSKNLTDF